MPENIIVISIIFLAVFVQSVSGFGSALVAMSLLPLVVSIKVATPFVALLLTLVEIYLLLHYRHDFKWNSIWRVIVASVIGVPIGLFFLKQVNEKTILTALGVLVTGFALYALLNIRLPKLSHPAWGYVFGLVAGIIGGAYNTSGPPIIIYGNCRGWKTEEFKSNLQGFFVVSSFAIVIGHIFSGNFTSEVWGYFWLSIPAAALGIALGTRMDKYISGEVFRKIVLVLLAIIGLRLIVL